MSDLYINATQVGFLRRASVQGTAFPKAEEAVHVGDLLHRGLVVPTCGSTFEYHLTPKGRDALDYNCHRMSEVE